MPRYKLSATKEIRRVFEEKTGFKNLNDMRDILCREIPISTEVKLGAAFLDDDWIGISELASDKKRRFKFGYSFHDNEIYFMNGEVTPSSQNLSIASIITRNIFNFSQTIGIEEITVKASNIGVYSWGKLGFIPRSGSWYEMQEPLRKRLHKLISKSGNPSPELSSAFNTVSKKLESDDSKAFWDIIDQNIAFSPIPQLSLGKAMVLPGLYMPEGFKDKIQLSYNGVINLKSASSYSRAKTYLNSKGVSF